MKISERERIKMYYRCIFRGAQPFQGGGGGQIVPLAHTYKIPCIKTINDVSEPPMKEWQLYMEPS